MAVLLDADRRGLWQKFMADLSERREPIGALTKQDLRAAVDAVDQWVDDNKASLNAAIPLPARTALTAAQRAELLVYVVRQRFLKGA